MVISEKNDRQQVIRTSVYTRKYEISDWANHTQTEYFYNADDQPVRVVYSDWDPETQRFEVKKKKIFYYPVITNLESVPEGQNEYTIYPNPVSHTLHIKGPGYLHSATILNLQGKILLTSESRTINVVELSPGMYILRIEDDMGRKANHIFVKL
jgi:hypothetical protein